MHVSFCFLRKYLSALLHKRADIALEENVLDQEREDEKHDNVLA